MQVETIISYLDLLLFDEEQTVDALLQSTAQMRVFLGEAPHQMLLTIYCQTSSM